MDKKIIIVWSFGINYIETEKMKEHEGVYFKEFMVGKSNDKKLLAVRLDREASDQQCETIIKFVRDKLNFHGEYLLLIHNKPATWMLKSLKKNLHGIDFVRFGGGSAWHKTLYKKLIIDSDYFQESAFAEYFQTIKEKVFDEIWREYKVLREIQ